jgi:hypothetical protein
LTTIDGRRLVPSPITQGHSATAEPGVVVSGKLLLDTNQRGETLMAVERIRSVRANI